MGESDADWSVDVHDRKLGGGAALSWGVKKQATLALSSSEAKYQGMAAAVQETLYLKQLLGDCGILFWHPTGTSNSNWRGQPELHQFVPKPNHAQEEQTHWDKISLHSGQDGRWDYFNSLRSYWQNGSRHLHEIFTRIKGSNFQNCFDRNRLYAISSNLSGGVRISIKL